MTERQIREVIADVCAELDRRARSLLVPSLLGAGLMLAGCGDRAKPDDGGAQPAYGVPPADARIDGGAKPLYAAPSDFRGDRRLEQGIVPPYMAPDVVAPPAPEYMVPPVDGGMGTLYSAPAPDLKT